MVSDRFEDFRNFQIFIISAILKRYVCIRHSQQKLLERPFFTEADLNDTLLLREDGLNGNELVSLSHATLFHPKLEAGGKPSTWFPPGELVELSTSENVPERCNSMKILVLNRFLRIIFFHFLNFDIFKKFSISKIEHHFSAIWICQDQKSISFRTEKLTFMVLLNFKILWNFWFLSCFIIFGVRVACFLDCSFLLEHFCFKV